MQPHKATVIIYAKDDAEAKAFETEFYNFVNEKRNQGIAVSAKKLIQAIKMFKDNSYLNNFLKM